MDGTKNGIRRALRERRREVGPTTARAAERAVLRHLDGFVPYRDCAAILAYVSTDGEFPTAGLLHRAWRDGKRVFLPRLDDDGIRFAEHGPDRPLRAGKHGIPEPNGPVLDIAQLNGCVVFLPLVAWDESGARLGRGGGHYDRAVAAWKGAACLIGLGYDFQRCVTLPVDPWDVPMDYVLTERSVTRCTGEDFPPRTRKEATQIHGLRLDRHQHRPGDRVDVGARLPAPTTD